MPNVQSSVCGRHLSWLYSPEGLIAAEYDKLSPFEPFSSVTELIQGISERFPQTALKILRSRIFTTEPYNDLSWGMARIAAKRISFDSNTPDCDISILSTKSCRSTASRPNVTAIQNASIYPNAKSRSYWLINEIISTARLSESSIIPRHEKNRCVTAGLFDNASGRLLLSSRNLNGLNKSLHAEVILLQSWWETYKTPLPATAELWVSLEPCKMCAAMIHSMWPDISPDSVIFLERELGSGARDSILRKNGIGTLHS